MSWKLFTWALAVVLVLGVTGAQQQDGVFEYASNTTAKVLIMGKTANLKIFPNKTTSAYLTLKFTRVEELDGNGKPVLGHAISSLSGLTPIYSTGTRTSGDTDYTYVKMVFDTEDLGVRLPNCPSLERMAAMALAGEAKGARGPGRLSGPSAQQQPQQPPEPKQHMIDLDDPMSIKSLGDSSLAAAIASLTASTVPPPRMEAISHRRKLQQAWLSARATGAPSNVKPVTIPRAPAPVSPVANERSVTTGISVVTGEAAAAPPVPPPAAPGSPVISLTFFFGMSANKTFAYGKGSSVVVPADGLKFNIEASNWPFCSPLNNLRFDIALGTNMQEKAQAQLMLDPTIDIPNPGAMITDIYAGPSRHLMQPSDTSGIYLDMETAAALAAAGAVKQHKLPIRTAKLLISGSQAAVIDCATVALPSVSSSINSTVQVGLISSSLIAADTKATTLANATLAAVNSANQLGGSRLSLTFPFFDTLYYDPVVYFGSTENMNINIDMIAPPSNCTGIVCGRTAERHVNAAGGIKGGLSAHVVALVAAALVAALW